MSQNSFSHVFGKFQKGELVTFYVKHCFLFKSIKIFEFIKLTIM